MFFGGMTSVTNDLSRRGFSMKMNEVRAIAKGLDIKSFGKSKTALIKEIQLKEGNFDCYGSVTDYCDRHDCLFRSSCLSEKH